MSVTDKPHNKLIFSIGGGVKLTYRFIWGEKENGFATRCVTYPGKGYSAAIKHTHGAKPYMKKHRATICDVRCLTVKISLALKYVTQCKDEDFTEYKQKTS